MSSSGLSATSGSRLFWIMRNAASCGQPRQCSALPRGARTVRAATVTVSIVHRLRICQRIGHLPPVGLPRLPGVRVTVAIPAYDEVTSLGAVVAEGIAELAAIGLTDD